MKNEVNEIKDELVEQRNKLLKIYRLVSLFKKSKFFNHVNNEINQLGISNSNNFLLFNLNFTMPRIESVEKEIKTIVDVLNVKIEEL